MFVCTDFNGNTYILSNGTYYTLIFNDELSLLPITDTKVMEEYREDIYHPKHIAEIYDVGSIELTDNSLKGLARETIRSMNDEEIDQNHLINRDLGFVEDEYYCIKTREEIDDIETYNYDIANNYDSAKYRFCDVSDIIDETLTFEPGTFHTHICHASILDDGKSEYNTVLIDGNSDCTKVTSVVTRSNGYNTKQITFYTDGAIKIQTHGSECKRYMTFEIDGTLTMQEVEKRDVFCNF